MSRIFCKTLSEIADKYNIPHDELEVEITESVFEEDINVLIDNVNRIKDEGFYYSRPLPLEEFEKFADKYVVASLNCWRRLGI